MNKNIFIHLRLHLILGTLFYSAKLAIIASEKDSELFSWNTNHECHCNLAIKCKLNIPNSITRNLWHTDSKI